MTRKLANKTLLVLATALACAGGACSPSLALASTGGANAPTGGSSGTPAKTSAKAQIATWFGPGFYGQKTACGQTMTPVVVGVASRTLPCGTLVLVNYKGHKLTVPVIDRGPYAHNGATWDLTWGAASALTINETVRIKTKIVGKAKNGPLLGAPAEVAPPAQDAASGGTAAG
ncbi:MAG TPA: septal ring lytic transglycosylase RlpA family protein [Solirubrobacteraceae bacterium]|jgi:rare lipoprotein A (peptidoglycan hydrolase)